MHNPYHPNPTNPQTIVCSCSICRKPIRQSDFDANDVADQHVYSVGGELRYINLAHKPCAQHAPTKTAWKWDD